MKKHIEVAEAEAIVAGALAPFPAEAVALGEAQGRVLREPVYAERDQPPFHRVTMDGVAFRFGAYGAGQRRFCVEGVQRAGEPARRLSDPQGCLEVMTGAVLPEGCDCVVPVEEVAVEAGVAALREGAEPVPMRYVHGRGTDHPAGTLLLQPGVRLDAPSIAVAASAGRATLQVGRAPSVGVLATGDELVDPGEPVEPYRIRRSNDYALAASLRLRGFDRVHRSHVPDDPERLQRELGAMLESCEVVLLTGGVSMGRFDYVPDVLHAVGVKALFHKVKQRPGKPLLFGVTEEGRSVFALPGNPVSALVCQYRYVLPALERALGLEPRPRERAALRRPVAFAPALTYFLPVRLETDGEGRLWADPRPVNTSGDFAALAGADGFVELDADTQEFPEGHAAPVYRWM